MEPFLCFVVLLIVLVPFLIQQDRKTARLKQEAAQIEQEAAQIEQELETGRTAYSTALLALQQAPSDPVVKHRALAAGRAFLNLTRDKKGVTMFDELALSNDIAAATAAASAAPIAAAPQGTPAERLQQLEALKAQGLVSASEYATLRQQILDAL